MCIMEPGTQLWRVKMMVKMMVRKRRQHSVDIRIAREGLEGSKTVRQLLSEHEFLANLIRAQRRQLQGDGHRVYATNALCALTSTDHIRLDSS